MREVENIADRVIFINKGKVLLDKNPRLISFADSYSAIYIKVSKNKRHFLELVSKYNLIQKEDDKYLKFFIKNSKINKFLAECYHADIYFSYLEIVKHDLEDFFVSFTRKK
jgi:ABC-type multidrug transport system ATPase subunit